MLRTGAWRWSRRRHATASGASICTSAPMRRSPEVYEFLEGEEIRYANRLPANREPVNRGRNDGRWPDKAVRRNLGAGCGHVPVIAGLPPTLERCIMFSSRHFEYIGLRRIGELR
jgi:hypothetical protein